MSSIPMQLHIVRGRFGKSCRMGMGVFSAGGHVPGYRRAEAVEMEGDGMEREQKYIAALYPHRPQIPLDSFMEDESYPMSRVMQAGGWLQLVIFVSGAKKILDVGTGSGYFSAVMAEAVRKCGGRVVSLAAEQGAAFRAKSRWEALMLHDIIEQQVGDPEKLLQEQLPDSFDLIVHNFKCSVHPSVMSCLRVLRVGGLYAGVYVLKESEGTTDYGRLQPQGRAAMEAIASREELESLLLPLGHGLIVARKPEPPGGVISQEYLD